MAVTLFEIKENCCGCGACANACGQKAISMEEDEFGFQYPQIDERKCISCGACQKVCGHQSPPTKYRAGACYGATAKEEPLLERSASGGVFAVLAKEILAQGGVVYGAAMPLEQGGFMPKHIRIDDAAELPLIQGSKYVQSDTGTTFLQTKEDLQADKRVLYSGTPCQIAGLLKYLGKEYDNLLTAEVICHGVPSAKMFRDFISVQEEMLGGKITGFAFRSKEKKQTKLAIMQLSRQDRISQLVKAGHELSYLHYFAKGLISRDSCYQCPFATAQRVADITLGDFWGFHEEYPREHRLNDCKGISCVLTNTFRGEQIVDALKAQLTIVNTESHKIVRHNAQLNAPCKYSQERDVVLRAYRKGGYRAVEDHYRAACKIERLRYSLTALIPQNLKRQLKRMKGQLKSKR